MRQSMQLKPIRGRQLSRLRQMYDRADCPRLRRRVQFVLLMHAGYTPRDCTHHAPKPLDGAPLAASVRG
jgi:hypothetical protein